MLCWRLPYTTHFQTYCCVGCIIYGVGGTCTRCCVVVLTYTTHFQIYVVLGVLDVALEVHHTQHIFKYIMYVLLEVVDVVLEVYHTQRTFKRCV